MWLVLGLLAATVIFISYLVKLYLGRNADYWQKRGFTALHNDIPLFDVLLGKKFMWDCDMKYYETLGDRKFGGAVEFGTPVVFVKDLELAKNIFVKDFDHFVDRRVFGKDPVISESLFFLTGQK